MQTAGLSTASSSALIEGPGRLAAQKTGRSSGPSCCQCGGRSAVLLRRLADLVAGLAGLALHLAEVLLDVAGQFLRVVAGDLADHFLDRALDLALGAFGAVVVHRDLLSTS